MKEMHQILKFINLESSTFKKVFLCTSDRFLFIGGYIYFTKLFPMPNKFKDLLRLAWCII